MLRFVDVFPTLSTPAVLARHLKEYFGDIDGQLPGRMHWALGAALGAGPLGVAFASKVIQYSIEKLGSQFIVGRHSNTGPEEPRQDPPGRVRLFH